jgi:hypothetical protein
MDCANSFDHLLSVFTPKEWVEVMESFTVIVASVAALFGFYQWRKEERWKRKYELAEDVLSKFYEFRDTMRLIRSPFLFDADEEKSASEAKDGKTHTLFRRYDNNKEAIDKLMALRFRFITVFEKKHENLFEELNSILGDVFIAASQITFIRRGDDEGMDRAEKGRKLKQLHKTIYWSDNIEEDPVSQRIKALIDSVEKVCNKIIGH